MQVQVQVQVHIVAGSAQETQAEPNLAPGAGAGAGAGEIGTINMGPSFLGARAVASTHLLEVGEVVGV